MTRLESPGFSLQRSWEDLADIARQAVYSQQAAYVQKGVALEVKGASSVWVNLDRKRVTQIIVNLLSNALKYTPAGGSVTVTVEEGPGHACLKVSDTGIGMDPSEIPRVFERFYRTDKSRNRQSGGSGIGLAVVKTLVDAHGGNIRMESGIGKGTVVQVEFPKSIQG